MSRYPESRTRGLVKIKSLEEGEKSTVYRVRGPEQLHEWLGGMTAEERGRVLYRAMLTDVTPVQAPAVNSAAAQHGQQPAQPTSRTGVTPVLTESTLKVVNAARRGGLSQPALDLLDQMNGGATLQQERGAYWLTSRTGQRERVATNTVLGLLRREVIG